MELLAIKGEFFGFAAVINPKSFGRAWYVLRRGQLLLGLYQCGLDLKDDPISLVELKEAHEILRSAQWEKTVLS